MLHPLEIPTIHTHAPCDECRGYVSRLASIECSYLAELAEAFESTEIAETEHRCRAEYNSVFRDWMEHKLSHETGSLKRYLDILKS
jgi:hypothetical protein